jgi:transcriptional regulator with XRE-family HTH domain
MPGDDYRRRVGARIRRARKAAGLTQHQLAIKLVNVQAAQISRWERGENMPSPRSMQALEEALEVPAETFLRSDDEPEPDAG